MKKYEQGQTVFIKALLCFDCATCLGFAMFILQWANGLKDTPPKRKIQATPRHWDIYKLNAHFKTFDGQRTYLCKRI